jgi:hypothetical protein
MRCLWQVVTGIFSKYSMPNGPIPEIQLPRIITQTSRGNDIDNYQIFELSPSEIAEFERIRTEYETRECVVERAGPNPLYNCHGLSFAARRTNVEGDEWINLILADDRYRPIDRNEVKPGDIAIYYTKNEAEHSAVVVRTATAQTITPLVFSKWGKYKEFLHPAHVAPYDCQDIRYFRIKNDYFNANAANQVIGELLLGQYPRLHITNFPGPGGG